MNLTLYKSFPEFTIYVDDSMKDRGTSHIDQFVVEGKPARLGLSLGNLHRAIEWMWGGGGEGRTPYDDIKIEKTPLYAGGLVITRKPV